MPKTEKYAIPHSPEFAEVVDRILAQPAGRILDIPSGNMWLSRILNTRGFECVADDICYESAREFPDSRGIETAASSLDEPLPYEARSFDYVACLCGLEHIANPYLALREFARVLREGGRAYVMIPNVGHGLSRVKYLLRGELSDFPYLTRDADRGHMHIHPLLLTHVAYVAGEYGFEVADVVPLEGYGGLRTLVGGIFALPILLSQRIYARGVKDDIARQSLRDARYLLKRQLLLELVLARESQDTRCVGDVGRYASLGM